MNVIINEHGTWQIEKVAPTDVRSNPLRFRYLLWYASGGKWWLIANQGRRKTCIELADAGYGIGEFKNE